MKSPEINQKLLDKIISVAYRDAGIMDLLTVKCKATINSDVKKLLEEYKATADSVHSIKSEEMPEHIIENVKQKIKLEKASENRMAKLFLPFIYKPAFSAAVGVLLVMAVAAFFIFRGPTPTYKYTEAEIELAQKQLGQSMAIINNVFRKTEQKIDHEVLPKHVSKPLNKGLNFINNYIIGG